MPKPKKSAETPQAAATQEWAPGDPTSIPNPEEADKTAENTESVDLSVLGPRGWVWAISQQFDDGRWRFWSRNSDGEVYEQVRDTAHEAQTAAIAYAYGEADFSR